jgi:hypothetical protein
MFSTYLYADPVLSRTTRSDGFIHPDDRNFLNASQTAAPSGDRNIPVL